MLGSNVALRPIQDAIAGLRRLEVSIVRGIEPGFPETLAKASNAETGHIGLSGRHRPGNGGVRVGSHLTIRHLGDDRHDFDWAGKTGDIAFAGKYRRRHGEIAELGQAPAISLMCSCTP